MVAFLCSSLVPGGGARVCHAQYACGIQLLVHLAMIAFITFWLDSWKEGDELPDRMAEMVTDFLPRWLGLWEASGISFFVGLKTYLYIEFIVHKGVN